MAVVKLNPRRKDAIAELLEESYDCINATSDLYKTSAKNLKDHPTWYLRGICSKYRGTRSKYVRGRSQKMMSWASWELARSSLDESVKNSVGILLFLDKVNDLSKDPIRKLIPTFEPDFLSASTVSNLYFSHFHAALSGLTLAGVIVRDRRFIARDVDTSPHWKCIDDSWEVRWNRPDSYISHAKIFERYDAIQRHQVKWLPARTKELKSLKKARETMTYHTEKLGGWDQREAVAKIEEAFPSHIGFQEHILGHLSELVEDGTWDRSFSPKKRTKPLRKRFGEYQDLASYCLQ